MKRKYMELLDGVTQWYRSVQTRFPQEAPCSRGCRDCCVGLFDITGLDVALLREGLAGMHAQTRDEIQTRAAACMARLRAQFPELGANLADWNEAAVEALCAWAAQEPCPALGPENECLLYAHRPLTCRLHGVPLVDHCGAVIQAEGCKHCKLKPEQTPTLAFDELVTREHHLLEEAFGEAAHLQFLIPQALESQEEA